MTEELETQRLRLRPLRATDAQAIARQINDPDITRWLTAVPYPYAIKDAEAFIAGTKAGPGAHFAICRAGSLIGVVSVVKQLGYWLAKPFWGRGLMSEAARVVVDRHFLQGAAELKSGYLIGNAASAKVLTKLGFKATDVIDSPVASLGRSVPNQQMRLTRAGWEALT